MAFDQQKPAGKESQKKSSPRWFVKIPIGKNQRPAKEGKNNQRLGHQQRRIEPKILNENKDERGDRPGNEPEAAPIDIADNWNKGCRDAEEEGLQNFYV